MPREIKVAAAVQAKREQYSFVALAAEIFQGKVFTEPHVHAKFRTEVENFANLRLQDIAGQPVFRDAEMHHSTRHRRGFENGDGIAEQRQIVRRRHAGWTGANDGDLFRPDGT